MEETFRNEYTDTSIHIWCNRYNEFWACYLCRLHVWPSANNNKKKGTKYTYIQKCNCSISKVKILSTALHSPTSVPIKSIIILKKGKVNISHKNFQSRNRFSQRIKRVPLDKIYHLNVYNMYCVCVSVCVFMSLCTICLTVDSMLLPFFSPHKPCSLRFTEDWKKWAGMDIRSSREVWDGCKNQDLPSESKKKLYGKNF